MGAQHQPEPKEPWWREINTWIVSLTALLAVVLGIVKLVSGPQNRGTINNGGSTTTSTSGGTSASTSGTTSSAVVRGMGQPDSLTMPRVSPSLPANAKMPVYQFSRSDAVEAWTGYLSFDKTAARGWKAEGYSVFDAYSPATRNARTVPIYRSHSASPLRFRYSMDPQPDPEWKADGIAFCAFPLLTQEPGTKAVYEFRWQHETDPVKYIYTTVQKPSQPEWGEGKVAFKAYHP